MADEKKIKEKPLEKMTSKELRAIALEIPEVMGAHGMNKPELISVIKKARNIEEKALKKGDSTVREKKEKINELKIKRKEANDKKKVSQLRRRISKLKKKTRRVV